MLERADVTERTTPASPVGACAWAPEQLGDALSILARMLGTGSAGEALKGPDTGLANAPLRDMWRWLEQSAASVDMVVEVSNLSYRSLPNALSAPSLFPVRLQGNKAQWLVLTRVRGREAQLLAHDGLVQTVALDEITRVLREPLEAPMRAEAENLVRPLPLLQSRKRRVQSAMLLEQLGDSVACTEFHLSTRPPRSALHEAQQDGVLSSAMGMIGAGAFGLGIGLASTFVIGYLALSGRVGSDLLVAFALLMATQLTAMWLTGSLQGRIAMRVGRSLRRRMVRGLVRLNPDAVRGEGVGRLLGRVLESQVTESHAIFALLAGVIATLEWAMAFGILLWLPAGRASAWLEVFWLGAMAALWPSYASAHRDWVRARLALTHNLVESIAGHRTRQVFERPEDWHVREDAQLASYHEASRRLDRKTSIGDALVSRGALVVGVLSLWPDFVTADQAPETLAAALFAVLMMSRALRRIVAAARGALEITVAFEQLAPVFDAATEDDRPSAPLPGFVSSRSAANEPASVVEAHDLVFRHRVDAGPMVQGCSLRIQAGDRLLLTGPSGGGKSTLAALLAGLRTPQAGALLHRGLDRATLGAAEWSRRVSLAPQFHENHVFSNTLLFNLLMGGNWPPAPEDVAAAHSVCEALGLTPLIQRMPAGLAQRVGESGWQLSHGERSRVFIARALLQNPQLLMLDESFGALDPATHRQALDVVMSRAHALMVIAHPADRLPGGGPSDPFP